MNKVVICLVGPSGCGKTTIAKILLEEGIAQYFIRSTTTRPKGEKENTFEYDFVESINTEDLVEHTVYDGNIYGISKKVADEALKYKVSVVAVDINGANALTMYYNDKAIVVTIGIDTPNLTLKKRLLARGRGKVKERLERADLDREAFSSCNYIFVNDAEVHMDYVISNIEMLLIDLGVEYGMEESHGND